jgi:hypothetical protein
MSVGTATATVEKTSTAVEKEAASLGKASTKVEKATA